MIELQNQGGGVLSSKSFIQKFSFAGDTLRPASQVPFYLTLPFSPGTARIVLKKGATELASQRVSPNPPVVRVTSPNGGENLSGKVNINWTASDADGDPLTYFVFYSADGVTWLPIAMDLRSTTFEWDTNLSPGSQIGRIMVAANDGVNQASDASDGPFNVSPKGPLVGITTPLNGAMAPAGRPILFQGSGYDFEDGELPGAALTFSSNLDGALGQGRALFAGLSIGAHTITLTGTDKDGNRATASIKVTVAANAVTSVSAASYLGQMVASESIVAAFGVAMATQVEVASALPLPTSLAGTTVKVRDSAGTERLAPLFFVSPNQINYQVPPGTANGIATVTISSGDGTLSIGTINIVTVAPGIFAANSDGRDAAAALVLRVKSNGAQSFEPVTRFDPAQNRFVTAPIDLGPDLGNASDQVFLVLFGTGLRFRSALSAVTCNIGGVNSEVLFAGGQGGFVGLDQMNVRLARSLAGRGEMDVVVTVDGKAANTVKINVK